MLNIILYYFNLNIKNLAHQQLKRIIPDDGKTLSDFITSTTSTTIIDNDELIEAYNK